MSDLHTIEAGDVVCGDLLDVGEGEWCLVEKLSHIRDRGHTAALFYLKGWSIPIQYRATTIVDVRR